MRSLLLASLLALASSPGQAAPAPERAEKGRAGMFCSVYDPPKDPKRHVLYERFRKAKLLEKFSEALSSIRLPKPLLIKFASCDGTSNAWYEPSDGTVTFCYEYVADPYGFYPTLARPGGVDVRQYRDGTLIIDLIDAATKQMVWRGTTTDSFDPGAEAKTVSKAIEKTLAEYPPPL
jgi:Putative metallopeptidase/Domain of unknown function (DUF4136)